MSYGRAVEITHRTVTVDGLELHLAEAGPAGRADRAPAPRLPRVLVLVAPPARRRLGARRLPRRRARPARLRAARARRRRSRTTRCCTSSATRSACSTRWARSRRSSSGTTGARRSPGTRRCCGPTGCRASSRSSVPLLPRSAGPPTAAMARRFGDRLLPAVLPAPRASPTAELAADPRATFRRLLVGDRRHAAPARRSRCPRAAALLDACPEPRRPAGVAHRGRSRRLRRRVRRTRVHRRAELVPQPRPQLGAHRRLAGRAGQRCPRPYLGGRARPGDRGPGVRRRGRDAAAARAGPARPPNCCPAAATGPSRSGPPRPVL